MHGRFTTHLVLAAALVLSFIGTALAHPFSPQGELSAIQRLDVMRSKLDGMRRSLNSAMAPLAPKSGEKKNADDPYERLRSLDKEVGSLSSEVNNVRAKQDRAERYDPTLLDQLETQVTELNTRVQAGIQSTAGARSGSTAIAADAANSSRCS